MYFVFTLHDYVDSDIEFFNVYDFAYVCYGKEVCPTTGRKHLQGYFQLKKQAKVASFAPFKVAGRSKWFKPADGSHEECINYCKKDGDFYERGVPTPHKGKGARSDLVELQSAIDAGATYDTICNTFFEAAAKYSRFIKERIVARDEQLVLSKHRTMFSDFVLRPWQQNVVDLLECPVHPRQINWLWEGTGNTGKSTMASYLEVQKDALVLEAAGKKDLAYIISQTIGLKEIVVFDLARCQEPDSNEKFNPLAGFYNVCEGLKNGCITNTKYESKRIRVNVPHVWVFANFQPDYTKWSEDRYKVWTIKDNTLIESSSLFKDL